MKKFLSLVLAVIMTMSLVTIGANAAEYKDFTDKDEIQYEEAVAVLNRLGIITGYSEGDFRPEGELTRGAAAKIIVSLLIGPEAANNVSPTSAPYSDVPLDHTFAGPIAYCKTAKIIDGYKDGSFHPGDTLTGYAFSKMLLGALGFDGAVEGFTGSGWNMNVNARAAEAGLFDRISFKGNEPVNREQAAQLALNTLKATMVEYSGGINVSTSDGSTMTSPATRTYKISNQEYATHIRNRKASQVGNATGDTHYTVEFGEEHFVDLRMTFDRSALDDFGRPSNEWSYKKVTIGTFPIEADKVYTEQVAHNVDTVTNASKARALELTGFEVDSKTVVTVNGKAENVTLKDVGEIANYTDNGTVVEVYISEDDADHVDNVVVIKTQLMEVKRLSKDSVSLDLYDNGSANKGKIVMGFNQEPIDKKVDNVEVNDAYYTLLSGLKVGDRVAVVPVTTDGGTSYSVAKAYVPETVSGNLKKVSTYGTSNDVSTIGVTVGDTAYDVALWNKDLTDIDGQKLDVTTKDVTLTLDELGNALLAEDVGATSDYMVIGSYYQNLVSGKLMTYVKGWDISGEELDLNLGSKYATSAKYREIQPGDLVYYTNATTGDADWTLNGDTDKGVFDVYTGADDKANNALYSIKASNSRIRTNQPTINDSNPWIDKSIKFIYVTFNDDDDVDSIEIKNGVQAVANNELTRCHKYTNHSSGEACNYNAAQLALKLKDGKVTADSTVKAVVIKNESNDAVASNMLYVVNYKGGAGKDSNGDIVYEYTVAMNGANGLIDDEMTIYSTKKLSRGDWARYTEVKNDSYDNFYKLTGVDQRGRATSTMVANFKADASKTNGYPVINNKSLVKVDPDKLYAIDGTALSGKPSANVKYCLPYITNAMDNGLGVGDNVAQNLLSLRYATWVDLTNKGIDSYEDLADLIEDGEIKDLGRVKVSMIFNDDSTKDNFRQVAMIVVQSVTDSSSSNGSSGSAGTDTSGAGLGKATVNNTEIDRNRLVNEFGEVIVTVDVTKPSWVANGATLSYDVAATVDGVKATINGNSGKTTISNADLSESFQLAGVPKATDNSKVNVTVSDLKWSAVTANVASISGNTNGDVAVTTDKMDVGTGKSVNLTVPANAYTAAKVTVKQAGQEDQTKTEKITTSTSISVSGFEVLSSGAVSITVEMTPATKTPVAKLNLVGTQTAGPVETSQSETKANAYVASIKKWDAGTYEFPTAVVQENVADGDNPLYRGGNDVDDSDCMIFVFEKSGRNETYTLEIDDGVAYREVLTPTTANDTSNSFFHVQVNDANSTYFANSGSAGTMRTMALSAGEHTYTVTASESGLVLSGKFTIAKKGANGGADVQTAPTIQTGDNAPSGDEQIKSYPNGAYTMPDNNGIQDVNGGNANNRIFKFTTPVAEKATLKIMASDGEVVYTETAPDDGTFAAGPHYFYVQVTGENLANAGTGLDSALDAGTYTYTVHGSESGMLLYGSMIIRAST